MYSNATNILSIVIIFVVVIGTALAIVISTFFISYISHFSIITGTANICYTREVRDSNIKVNIYIIQNRRVIGYTLAVNTLYSFINIKWGNKLLKILFPLRIFKINKYLIILTPFFNFIVRGIYKGLIAGIIIMDYLGTANNNKARL